MPRARLPQIQSISAGSFEPNRRNPILLGEDSFLDDHQKPIRIGEIASPLSLSKNTIRIDGDFHLEGKLANPLLTTDFEYLELRAEENIRFTSSNSSGSLDIFVFSGDSYFTTSGNDFYFIANTAGDIKFGNLVGANNLNQVQFDLLNSQYDFGLADTNDFFRIDVDSGADITMENTSSGSITIDSSGDINIDAATGNITVKDNGGNYTPSSDYHIATKKYVDDNAGGGASELNDLSDVTYSSGDLTIQGLSQISAITDLEIEASGGSSRITLDAGAGRFFFKEGITTNAFIRGGSFNVKEQSSAHSDSTAYGQIWVKNDTPNNLYFTDDTGTDIPITNNGELNAPKAKTYLDWYYYQASLSSNNVFYVSLHHDEFGVTSIANTNISDYDDTTAEDMWRIIRYAGRRVPYTGTVTKFMAHVESSGASADSDVEVGVWLASKPTLDTELASTTNMTIDNLGYMTFDFSSASRFLHKETTSFNATSVTQGDFMFITVRKTSGTDGTSFWIHSTVTMDIS